MLCKRLLMFIMNKIIRFFLFFFYIVSLYAANNEIGSAYFTYDPAIVLYNAHQCYKDGLCEISFDLCRAYIENEQKFQVPMNSFGVNARVLLALNLLKKRSPIDKAGDEYRFNFAEDLLLEICCNPEKTKAIDENSLVYFQDCAWRILAQLYVGKKEYRESALCLYNSLAVQYNGYNEKWPYIFPRHTPGQLRLIVDLMKQSQAARSLMEKVTAGLEDQQMWFLSTLFERAWLYDDSLSAPWLLVQYNRKGESLKLEYQHLLYIFKLHAQTARAMRRGGNININAVRVELAQYHPELADSYSIMACNEHNVQKFSVYRDVKKNYLDYVRRRSLVNQNKKVFLAILNRQVIGKGILHIRGPKIETRPSPDANLYLYVADAYKQKRVGARLTDVILSYAQKKFNVDRVMISSNKTEKASSPKEFNLARVLEAVRMLK